MTYEDLGRELNVLKDKLIYCYDRKGTKYPRSEYKNSFVQAYVYVFVPYPYLFME